MNEAKKENKKKEIWKKIRGFLVIVMVAVISIAGTLAYLSRKTDRVTNTFTATDDIEVEVTEPKFTPPPGGYQPDVEYPKDPRLANVTGESDGGSEWVIMRVDYRTFTDSEPVTADGKTTKTRTYIPVSYDDIIYNNTSENNLEADVAKGLISIIDDLNSIPNTSNWIKVKPEWLDTALANQVFGTGWKYDENDTTKLIKGTNAQKCDYFIYKKVITSGTGTTKDSIATNTANLKSTNTTVSKAAEDFFDGAKNTCITTPLFTTVKIKSQEQLEKNGYTMSELPGFTIDVMGGAIKNQGDESVEIEDGILDTTNLATAGTEDSPNVSRTIVNELVKLLVNEDIATSETIEVTP